MPSTVVSLGYEKRDIQEFINVLCDLEVTKVLDVRIHPFSRKKGFSKAALAKHLQGVGISYEHLREAGNPYHALKLQPNECLEMYSVYLDRNPQVLDLVESCLQHEWEAVALVCYERKREDCHRGIIIDKLLERFQDVTLLIVE